MAATARHEIFQEEWRSPWRRFRMGLWWKEINVRDFIQQKLRAVRWRRVVPRDGRERTRKIWGHLKELFVEERTKGVFDVSQIPSSITSHSRGYIDRKNELIVGLQTEAPLYGVSRLVEGKQQEKRLDAAMSTDDTIRDR
jgi:formate C-acetyltransferase